MLYPMEDKETLRTKGQRKLLYVCRTCHTKEEAGSLRIPVYRNVVSHTLQEKTVQLYDVASDPTLPKTHEVKCRNCGNSEACYFQSPVGKNDDALVLYFVCTSCSETWLSSDM
mmetsp:Transcript_81/g.139  ORF Transcript_81/g.139 Transcript_81/m.139 type:complete len:113 (-) Transcript_81:1397-1735(-)